MTSDASVPSMRDRIAYRVMMTEIVTGILAFADRPTAFAEAICHEMRELTGAKSVALYQVRHVDGGEDARLAHANPQRRASFFRSAAARNLLEVARKQPRTAVWTVESSAPGVAGALGALGVDTCCPVPLTVGNAHVGTLLLVDLPIDHNLGLVVECVETLSTIVALVLRNALLFENQEEVIAARTAALQESEERYRLLVENQTDMIVKFDTQGRLLFASPSYCKTFGKTQEELLGAQFIPLVHPDDRAEVEKMMERIKRPPHRVRVEERAMTAEGWRWQAWHNAALLDGDGNVEAIIAAGRDITDKRQAEEALSQSETKFRELFDNMSSGVAVYEALDQGKDFVFLDFNKAGQRIERVTREQVVGRRVTEAFPGAEAMGILGVFRRVWRTGKPEHFPMSFYEDERISGWRENYVYRLPSGHVVAVYDDVTERKQAEVELLKSRQRLALHVKRTPLGVIEWDLDFQVLRWNPAAETIFGYTAEEAIGRHAAGLIVPRSAREQVDRIWEGLCTQTGGLRSTNENITKDGQTILCAWYNTPLVDRNGTVLGVASLVQEITERKRAEEERERLIRELEAQNAELERFAYTVSHDLKSPLITIKGYLGLIEEDLVEKDFEAVSDDLARMSTAADKMAQLLGELLELSRVGRLVNPSEDVSLGELAHEAAELVAGQIREQGVRVEICDDLPIVFGDRARLLEVMQNLVDNAVKYIGEGTDGRIEIGCRLRGDEAVCYIRDNGIGIDPRYHERVFSLFEQLDPKAEGSGVGLALVKRIVETHGGRIWVESEGAGRGSMFCFVIPTPCEPDSAAPDNMADPEHER